MDERFKIVLSSNWNTLGDANLKNILVNNCFKSSEIDIEDLKADNCVCLVQNNNNEKSKAELEVNANGCITGVTLLSEAQVIEVFGVNDEYLLTNNAEFFDDWEEMAVYYSKFSLPNIPVCKLKFTRTKCEKRLWIYGAKIQVQHKIQDHKSPVYFNFEQINRLLGNPNVGNQNNFKNIIQPFLEHLPNNNLSYILGRKVGADDCNSHTKDVRKDSSQENSPEEILSRLNLNGSQSSELKEPAGESIKSNLLLAYIDKKCNEMKNDILHQVDMKLNSLMKETNCKLDKIISLLENDGIQM